MQLIPWKHRNGARPLSANLVGSPFDAHFDALVQQVFGEPLGGEAWTQTRALATAVDVTENEGEVLVRAELPGVDPEQIQITFDGGVLTLAGEKRAEANADKDGWRVSERRFGAFERSFRIAAPIDESKIAAEHKHGVLTVRLPKVAPVKPRKIDIKSS
jgi:HSP20 family protein